MNPFTAAVERAMRASGSKVVVGKSPRHTPPDVHPEPGEWVYDMPKGMKPVHRPEPLPEGKISNEDVRHQVRYDGIGHCVLSLIPEDRIADPRLRELWRIARKGMQEVLEHLEDCE